MHDDYDSISNAHDIALIELDKPVPFHKVHLRPACLQLNEYYQPNVTAVSNFYWRSETNFIQDLYLYFKTGWGQLKQYSRSETSDQLMKVVLPVEKIIKCKRYLESKVLSSTRQMCAGGKDGKVRSENVFNISFIKTLLFLGHMSRRQVRSELWSSSTWDVSVFLAVHQFNLRIQILLAFTISSELHLLEAPFVAQKLPLCTPKSSTISTGSNRPYGQGNS